MMIASLADLIDMMIEGQSLVHQYSKTLDDCGWLYRDTRRFQGAQDVASASTGGKMDDISFRGVEREAVVEKPLMYASDARLHNGGLQCHCVLSHCDIQLCVVGVLVMMDAKRLDHFRQWSNIQ
jgi:hypothetical protein